VMNYLMRVSEGLPPPEGRGGSMPSSVAALVTCVNTIGLASAAGAAFGVAAERANMGKAMPWPFSRA